MTDFSFRAIRTAFRAGTIIILLLILLIVGAFFLGRQTMIPAVQNRNALIEEMIASHQTDQDQWQAQARQEYHRGVYDLCVIMSATMGWAPTCNKVVTMADSGDWYDMGSRDFVWPPEPADDDG